MPNENADRRTNPLNMKNLVIALTAIAVSLALANLVDDKSDQGSDDNELFNTNAPLTSFLCQGKKPAYRLSFFSILRNIPLKDCDLNFTTAAKLTPLRKECPGNHSNAQQSWSGLCDATKISGVNSLISTLSALLMTTGWRKNDRLCDKGCLMVLGAALMGSLILPFFEGKTSNLGYMLCVSPPDSLLCLSYCIIHCTISWIKAHTAINNAPQESSYTEARIFRKCNHRRVSFAPCVDNDELLQVFVEEVSKNQPIA